jgi:hypothetical protein
MSAWHGQGFFYPSNHYEGNNDYYYVTVYYAFNYCEGLHDYNLKVDNVIFRDPFKENHGSTIYFY